MTEFKKTDKTTITRLPKRGTYDQDTIYSILDEALYCTLSWSDEGQSFQIPTGFCRIGNKLYIHGSVGSHYMRLLAGKKLPVCIGVTLIDGLVLARSAFHHSVNYRSVVLFSRPELVSEPDEAYAALEVFTNKVCPGRWDDVRKPTDNEWKATMVLSFLIEEVSAKVRSGPPKDDEEDYSMDVWAGVQPLSLVRGALIADPALKPGVAVPAYLKS
ncbi:MAG: pyridoxamine 5'-phosphate oxidase family protein [Cyclobacteriaceae bacterium]|nr:pyridoxamine 5'-phosphate oxidase family protein [Cyclobacteriaceae bacterium]